MENDLPVKRQRTTKRRNKTKSRKDRGEGIDAPRFIPTKKRTKFNKHKMMRML